MYFSVLIITDNPLAGSVLGACLRDSRIYRPMYALFKDLDQLSCECEPDILLFLGGEEKEASMKRAMARYPRAKALLIFRSASAAQQVEWLNQGIRGLINEDEDNLKILESVIARVSVGQVWAAPKVLAEFNPKSSAMSPEEGFAQMTARERAVMDLVSTGLSNAVVAGRLGIKEKTVKSHMTHIFQKLGVRNRVQATVRYREMKSRTSPGQE